jgi:hypothetical protein
MSDLFDNITTRLDIHKSSVDSSVDKVRSKGRAIKKVHTTITIPVDETIVTGDYWRRSIRQYNFSASGAFRILNYTIIPSPLGVVPAHLLCIKYREGSVVTRYRLAERPTTGAQYDLWEPAALVACQTQPYTNEIIKSNFSLEFWGATFLTNRYCGIELIFNALVIPASASITAIDLPFTIKLERSDVEQTLPLTLPVAFGLQAGTTN